MKIKILALIMAVFCLSTLFVGCNKETACEKHVDENKDGVCDNCAFKFCAVHKDDNADLTCDVCAQTLTKCEAHVDEAVDNVCDVCKLPIPVVCDTHKDDDANKICDACGGAIVVITEQIAPSTEEKNEMVVNPIPGNVNLGDYIDYSAIEDIPVTEIDKIDMTYFVDQNEYVLVYATYDEEEGFFTYSVYDFVNDKVVFKTNDKSNEDEIKSVNFSLYEYYFSVIVCVYDPYYNSISTTYSYYDYAGTTLASAIWTADSELREDEVYESVAPVENENNPVNGVVYITFGDDIYAFNEYDIEVLGKFNDKELIYRPDFDMTCGDKYGYITDGDDDKIYIYDLNKWIECVYVYEVPMHYYEYQIFPLSNGNLLVQGAELLPENAVNYDAIVYLDELEKDVKTNLVYTIIDPSAKTTKNVEFGYYVAGTIYEIEESQMFTDKVQNIAFIYPIVNGRFSEDRLLVVLNNDLTIAADISDIARYYPVTEDMFVLTEDVGGVHKTVIVDINGNEIAYVPYSAEVKDNYIVYDGKIYGFDMKELMDFDKEGFSVEYDFDNFAILEKYDEDEGRYYYYYYDFQSESAEKVKGQNNDNFSIDVYTFGYTVSYYDADGEYCVDIYNIENEKIGSFDADFVEYMYIDDMILVKLSNDEYYFVK